MQHVFSPNSKQLKIQLYSLGVAHNHKSEKHAMPLLGRMQKHSSQKAKFHNIMFCTYKLLDSQFYTHRENQCSYQIEIPHFIA